MVFMAWLAGGISTAQAQLVRNVTDSCASPMMAVIGYGTSTHSCLPTYAYYNYSLTQQVLPSDVFDYGAQKYTAIAFQYVLSNTRTRNLTIYLAHVPHGQTLSGGWITPSGNVTFHQVFSGSVTFSPNTVDANKWCQIELDTAFSYDGTSDVLLTVVDGSGYYNNTENAFRVHNDNTTANRTRYHYRDESSYNIANPNVTGSLSSNVNNIRFTFCDHTPCATPVAVTASNITDNSADISWSAGGAEAAWELQYRPVQDTGWTAVAPLTTATVHLAGLAASTAYRVRVRSYCGTGEFSNWSLADFTTDCAAITITAATPWVEDFETDYSGDHQSVSLSSCWATPLTYQASNGLAPFVYTGYTSASYSGANSLEFKGTQGMVVLPRFTNALNTLSFSLWGNTNASSASGAGMMELGVISDINNPATFVPLDTIPPTAFNRTGQDAPHANFIGPYDLVTVTPQPGQRLALRYSNSNANISWNLDDLTVFLTPACPSPAANSVTVSNLSGTQATVSFTDYYSSHQSWIIYYHPVGSSAPWSSVTVNSTTGNTLTGLTPATTYELYVKTMCNGAEGDQQTNTVTFTTTTMPATLPWTVDFEDATENQQWTLLNGSQTNKWYIGTPTNSSSNVNTTPGGSQGLYISNNGGASNTYSNSTSRVYAYRDILVPNGVTELSLSFDWKARGGSTYSEFLRVYWIDPAVPVSAGSNPPYFGGVDYDAAGQPGNYGPSAHEHWLSMQSTWQHEEMLITADQFTGMGNGDRVYRIYFHWRNTSHSNNPPAAVDHIELRAVSCPKPQNVAVSGVGDHAATVSWTGNANQYGVIVEAGGITTYQTTTDTFLVLQNLPSATTCEVTVRALCGTDSSMLSQPVSFVTTISSHDLPYFTDFSAGQDWQMVNGTCANYWTNGVTNSGQNALFVTNDGITEGYRTTSASTVMAENFFTMPATDSVYVEFDLRIGGESTWDYLKAFLAPIHVEYVAGATPNTQSPNTYATYAMDFTAFKSQTGSSTSYPYILNLTDGETVHVGTYMANPAPNGQAKFVFLWRNDAISGEQPGAVVTNFYMAEMAPTTCASPTNLTYALDADDHTSVTLTWQHEGTSVIDWQIDYRQITEEVWSSVTTANTTYTLTDLDPNMDYEAHVVAHCPNGLTSDASNTVIFHTDNDGIDDYLSKMVTLYPNPATETVIVAASDANITITGVEVYNVYGQNVETFHGTSPHNRTTINVSNLSAGLYHVRITTDSGVVTKKLVKR